MVPLDDGLARHRARFVIMGCNIPQYGLSFFLPQIVKASAYRTSPRLHHGGADLVGAIGMIFFGARIRTAPASAHGHAVIAFPLIIAGLGLASAVDEPTVKMLFLCLGRLWVLAVLPIFWTFPTAFLSGAGAAAGIAAVNSIGNLGGYFGPRLLPAAGSHRQRCRGLIFLAGCALV